MKTAIFSCLLLFAGIACAAAEPLNVYCTTFPLYLLTWNLTQGCRNVHTELIIPPGTGCPHDYALTPRDMRKLGAKNMVLVRNGLGLDDFILKPLRKMNPDARIIDTSAGIPALELEEKCGHDDCHEHHHGSKNPHLFASPFEAVRIVENIARGLEAADPANAAAYRANAGVYTEKLRKLCGEFTAAARKYRFSERKIVTQHGVFDYLAHHLKLPVAATISGEPEAGTTATEMASLVKKLKGAGISVIYTEPQYPSRVARTIGRECGIPLAELDPVANGPADAPMDYYEKTMRKNLEVLGKTLNQ